MTGTKTNRYLTEQLDQLKSERLKFEGGLRSALAELTKVDSQRKEGERRLQRVRDAFDGLEKDIWLRKPILKPLLYDSDVQASIPVVLVANLKGGVGKSTIAVNLAAYFEDVHDERVLVIDLDYQGSTSSMVLPEEVARAERTAEHAVVLIGGGITGEQILAHSYNVRQSVRDSRIIPCAHEFANYEIRLVLEWLVGDIEDDIRYNLARVLHSNAVQSKFQRVIIDAPPRVTTGFINALCASTHLLVPTVLDVLSADGVGSFLKDVNKLKGELFPRLQLLGVVGTMKRTSTEEQDRSEKKAVSELRRRLREEQGSDHYLLDRALIPRKENIARAAGVGIAYPDIKDIIRPLGEAVFKGAPTRRELHYESRVAQVAVR